MYVYIPVHKAGGSYSSHACGEDSQDVELILSAIMIKNNVNEVTKNVSEACTK